MELPKNKKIYFNIITALRVYVLIIRTEGVKPYVVSLIIHLQDFLIRLLVFKGYISKGI